MQGGYGARIDVTPVDCMMACSISLGCDSFAYNAEQKRCFLKSGAQLAICPVGEFFYVMKSILNC